MKKVISLLLVVMMAMSVVAVGAVSASAAEGDIAYPAGSRIFFDNSDAQWDKVYMYDWNYGYANDFIPMQPYNGSETLLSMVVPVDIPAGITCFLFTNSTDWSGAQTADIVTSSDYNTFAPSADGKAVVTSLTSYNKVPEVAITPYSKAFTSTIDVTVYAFNVGVDQAAYYQLNNAAPVAFTGSKELTLDATTTVKVTITDENEGVDLASTSCTFTKESDAVITVDFLEGQEYTGPMYIYTYGGDRIYPGFDEMTANEDGTYSYVLNGSAHIILTTTNDWDTAKKFLFVKADGSLAADQEPFVDFGQKVTFTVKLS